MTYLKEVLSKIPGQAREYISADNVICYDDEEANNNKIIIWLSSCTALQPLECSHNLTLKSGCIVILANLKNGLSNVTCLIIRRLHLRILDAEILTASNKFIPRNRLVSSNANLPFILHHTQFPLRLAYCKTINNSQGQTFDRVGV